jgi:methylated-DNA-[protein]-cysteine S-methyltransferase
MKKTLGSSRVSIGVPAGGRATRRDYVAVVACPAMRVGIRTDGERIAELVYLPRLHAAMEPRNALAERAARQIERYWVDPDAPFDLPLAPAGTPFQRQVWQALRRIARGRTRTYGEVARELDSAPRAVGQACGANPFPLVVPCHRVLAAGGLGGFAHAGEGFLLDIKRWLLKHEGAQLA